MTDPSEQAKAAALTDDEWREFQSIPDQGFSHRHWVDAKIASRLSVPVVAHSPAARSDSTNPSDEELPTVPGAYIGTRGGLFLLNREGNWFDQDGTPSDGHGNNPSDYLPLTRLALPVPLSDSTALIEKLDSWIGDWNLQMRGWAKPRPLAEFLADRLAAFHPLGVADSTSEEPPSQNPGLHTGHGICGLFEAHGHYDLAAEHCQHPTSEGDNNE